MRHTLMQAKFRWSSDVNRGTEETLAAFGRVAAISLFYKTTFVIYIYRSYNMVSYYNYYTACCMTSIDL